MRRLGWLTACAWLAACGGGSGPSSTTTGTTSDASGGDAASDVDLGSVDDFMQNLPSSCAFDCKHGCDAEKVGPFACPATADWSTIPHDPAACGASAPTLPAPSTGHCTIDAPTGEALRTAGPIAGASNAWVLPDGHRLTPAGNEAVLGDPMYQGLFPVSIVKVPGTHFAVVIDAGYQDHLARTIDLDKLAAGATDVVVSTEHLDRANWGAVVVADGAGKHRIYASGGALGKVWSLSFDDATGALALDATKTIDLGMIAGPSGMIPYFASAIALARNGKALLVGSVRTQDARIVSIDPATYGAATPTASLGSLEHFGVFVDPADATGNTAWATLWGGGAIARFDATTGALSKTITVPKNPESVAFLDARYLVTTTSDGDALAVIDSVAGASVATVSVTGTGGLHGFSPGGLLFDAKSSRLFVAESIINAVEVFDVTLSASAAPTLVSRGRIPTGWWPSDLAMDELSGRLLVLNARGHGTGSGTGTHFDPGNGEIAQVMKGSVQSIDLSTLDLTAASAAVAANEKLADVGGYPTPSCPSGSDYDFPVPATNTEGPSKRIGHIVMIVRENKNFDGVMGDFTPASGAVNGDAADVLVPGQMDAIWRNFRGIAKQWTTADNYYTDAEYSSQGHVWATFGRTTDFTERSWVVQASGKGRDVSGGVTPIGYAAEGSIFDWLIAQHESFDILGEGTGSPTVPMGVTNPTDPNYPGLLNNVGLADVDKSCYFAGRARARCDLHPFVYMTLPNDHTFGGGAGDATPETMIAVNDEATGTVVDALGKSPFWKDALVIITEDDPQDGADHVDLHRTPIVFAGPFVKRGYVAKGHYDVASIIKLIAHLRGLPYPNDVVARAPIPFEVFTSTPDYGTWSMLPRTLPRACNATTGAFALEASHWEFDEEDEQPGLGVHVRRMLRAHAAAAVEREGDTRGSHAIGAPSR